MLRFLADESCNFAVVRALRAAGYDVLAVVEAARGASDEKVIQLALSEERVLLTEDKDFGQLVFASEERSGGVIFIRFPADQRAILAGRIVDLVKGEGEKLRAAFVVVQPKRIRISTLPKRG